MLKTAESGFSPTLLEYLNEAAPMEMTEIYQEYGGHTELTLTGTRADGSSIARKYRYPRQGGTVVALNDAPAIPGTAIVSTWISTGEWCVTFLQEGKQSVVIHKLVGEEGNTMLEMTRVVDPQGHPHEQWAVWDRVS
jgi:hypothetical protein